MGEEILVSERIDAGAAFIREFNDSFPVSVACWVIPADLDDAYLYIASDDIDDSGAYQAYGEVSRRYGGKKRPWLDQFRIKVVNSSDPIARDAADIRDLYSPPVGIHYDGSTLGRTSIDGAYIYPPISAMTASPSITK